MGLILISNNLLLYNPLALVLGVVAVVGADNPLTSIVRYRLERES